MKEWCWRNDRKKTLAAQLMGFNPPTSEFFPLLRKEMCAEFIFAPHVIQYALKKSNIIINLLFFLFVGWN